MLTVLEAQAIINHPQIYEDPWWFIFYDLSIVYQRRWVEVRLENPKLCFATPEAMLALSSRKEKTKRLRVREMKPETAQLLHYMRVIPEVDEVEPFPDAIRLWCNPAEMQRIGNISAKMIITTFNIKS